MRMKRRKNTNDKCGRFFNNTFQTEAHRIVIETIHIQLLKIIKNSLNAFFKTQNEQHKETKKYRKNGIGMSI